MTQPARAFRVLLAAGSSPVRPHTTRNGQNITYRFYSASQQSSPFSAGAVVVGAGPAGITVVGNLLEHGQRPLVWVDPSFQGGRINAQYREVPSNTKVNLFVQFAQVVEPFKVIVDSAKQPNAFSALEKLPQDQGCYLSYAADLCLMLTEGLTKRADVEPRHSQVTKATLDERTNTWTVGLENGQTVTTSKLVLCTGSEPRPDEPSITKDSHATHIRSIHLDIALTPSKLAKTFDPAAKHTVAVIGASHSAILVLMNLVNLASSSHPHIRIKWFTRNPLRYAEYKDGWILRDNTGLKGQAAEWAHQNLDDQAFPHSPVSKIIKKVWTAENEQEMYRAELPQCTDIVQAIGYVQNPLPALDIIKADGSRSTPSIAYDPSNGRFQDNAVSSKSSTQQYIPGLFGAGIAFPERVKDPYGNVEYAVGFWKFMKFVKRVVPEWLGKP
ncbi:hypothetical protein F5Y17DRAFT_422731 [Xylariaceae sp. FL0594]|nr:hypothetical protein F5Y17DRAFT_422731 [Xylariaceae sp. FL0594]